MAHGLIPAGQIIAAEQFKLAGGEASQPAGFLASKAQAKLPKLNIKENKNNRNEVIISSQNFELFFNRVEGRLTSYRFQNLELLKEGPLPNFWRAPTDNDFGNRMPERLKVWREASQKREVKVFNASKDKAGQVVVKVEFYLPAVEAIYAVTYTIARDGVVKIDNEFKPQNPEKLPEIPRVGLLLAMPEGFEILITMDAVLMRITAIVRPRLSPEFIKQPWLNRLFPTSAPRNSATGLRPDGSSSAMKKVWA